MQTQKTAPLAGAWWGAETAIDGPPWLLWSAESRSRARGRRLSCQQKRDAAAAKPAPAPEAEPEIDISIPESEDPDYDEAPIMKKRLRKKTHTVVLNVTRVDAHPLPMSAEQLSQAQDKLYNLTRADAESVEMDTVPWLRTKINIIF